MIPNIVVPMPMPIHGGGGDWKTALAVFIAFFVIALCLNIGVWLRNGLKHKIWNPLIVVNDSILQEFARVVLCATVALLIILFASALIYSLL